MSLTSVSCLCQGAKLFYLSGMVYGEYQTQEVKNLGRFISVMKFRPLVWQTSHPYVLVDRSVSRCSFQTSVSGSGSRWFLSLTLLFCSWIQNGGPDWPGESKDRAEVWQDRVFVWLPERDIPEEQRPDPHPRYRNNCSAPCCSNQPFMAENI